MGSNLCINDTKFAKCSTNEQAEVLSDLIKAATLALPTERETIVGSFIKEQFDQEGASAALVRTTSLTRTLKRICIGFFVYLFVIVPILVNAYGLTPLIIPIGAIMLAFAVQIAAMFYGVHKTLCPDREQDRITDIVKMILCPPAAIRAVDLITTNIVAKFNPIVIAHLISQIDTEPFVRSFIRDLKYPLRHELSDQISIEIVKWYAAQQLSHGLEYVNRTAKLHSSGLFSLPANDSNSDSYCPRCGSQFNETYGECPDCPGIDLLPYGREKTPRA